jgi:serine/threonine protein kinase/class 3 adenylate cyclase
VQNDVEALLNARAEIDEQLRRHKNVLTVLFTDVVGSTSYFDRFGDTAGLAMVHLSSELGVSVVGQFGGTVVKTIGDSVMADFPDPVSAVSAAIEMQRRLIGVNSDLPEHRRMELRIGIHTGMGFRKGTDVFGDVVNLASRITKRTEAAQILISRAVQEVVASQSDITCRWLDKCTIDGRSEKEDIFEVIWTDLDEYLRHRSRFVSSTSVEDRDGNKQYRSPVKLPARYALMESVGEGAVGIVFKARDLETDEILALKVLKPEVAADALVQANFNKELRLARRITHKNVCRIYDLSRNEGTAYVSMEYVEGENLLKHINRAGKLPVANALSILEQVCAGLKEAHEQGVVHRDLKPSNVMIDQNGAVKIMDFGIARLMEGDLRHTMTIVGTPAYMSPEQADGKPVDARTDIYSLGLVLYEMVTGVAAFSGDTPVALALKQLTEAPRAPRELVPALPPQVEALIMKCLEKSSSNRFQSVEELENAIRTIASTPAKSLSANRRDDANSIWASIETANAHLHSSLKAMSAWGSRPWSQSAPSPNDPQRPSPSSDLGAGMAPYVETSARKIGQHRTLLLLSLFLIGPIIVWASISHAKKTRVEPVIISSTPSSATATPSTFRPLQNTAMPKSVGVSTSSVSLAPTRGEQSLSGDDDIERDSHTPTRPSPKKITARTPSIPVSARSPKPADSSAIAGGDLPIAASPSTPNPTPLAVTAQPPKSKSSPSSDSTQPLSANLDRYFDVGNFKDEVWAGKASENLEGMGFHTSIIHKGRLWMNSYHIIVGPFHSEKEADSARDNLESHGFKARPTRAQ